MPSHAFVCRWVSEPFQEDKKLPDDQPESKHKYTPAEGKGQHQPPSRLVKPSKSPAVGADPKVSSGL